MPAGRPTTYTPELAEYVCKIIATHACGLKKLTAMYEKFPHSSTIYAWLYDHKEFSSQYFEARRSQAAVIADSMLDLTDDIPVHEDQFGNERIDSGILGKAKLDYEIKKWHAAKMAPRIFGDRQIVENQNSEENEQLKLESKKLKEELDKRNKKEC